MDSFNQAVWLEDISRNAKTRNLDLGLPETLQIELKRSGHQDLTLNIVENKRLNQNAPVYEVHTQNGQNKLVKKDTAPITFYHDHANGGSFMVECSKRFRGECLRTLTGSVEIDDETFEIKPMPERLVSRALVVNNLNPHLLSRVIDRNGKGTPSVIARRGQSRKDLENSLSKELRRLLMKSKLDAFTIKKKKLNIYREKRQSTKTTYALEVLVGADPSIWKKYHATAVATATMTKDEATELFIRKRFSHIVNGPLCSPQQQIKDGTVHLPRLYDIYTLEGSTRSYAVLGISNMNGVCTDNRVSINEDEDYYTTTSVAAHELGHNLGAHHDGEKDDATASACPPADKFIMVPAVSSFSPGVAYTVNPWRFSTCSVKQFKNYIQSLAATDEYKLHSSKLPGELYSPTQQCQLEYGQESNFGCDQSGHRYGHHDNSYSDLSSIGTLLGRVTPKYLKLVTTSSISPFMVMSALVLLMLFKIIFDFSVLTSIPYEFAL
ncbi:A disintegrin and metalloproteinase with thrombospondin motifs 7-like [Dreissena polymorpha]|uniref:A disintegrin and metalloproteinase with thrombospondin motifs 7-like n=1 Tax=Dreissena polymorpha TaxID=45954 RepID=UPI0022644E01|nr:A disintegrin and metalloproteinase with thrombospondin motifs 7-like [Dreissena polymorpha]